jgi:hypothetical protein
MISKSFISLNQRERNAERGAVAIVFFALLIPLFGMAALAVDAGYLYQSSRGLQAAADAAVMAGLPALSSSTAAAAKSNATAMATANGYTSGVTVSTPAANQLEVVIIVAQPRFFSKALGFGAKTLTATSIGQSIPALPAVFARGTTCPSAATGIQFNGSGFTITGNVASNSAVNYYTGGTNSTNGSVTYNPACGYSGGSGNPAPTGGTSATGGSLVSPLTYTINSFPPCDYGTSLTTAGDLSIGTSGAAWWASGGPSGGTLNPGVYCAKGNISLGSNSVVGTVTFVATGQISLGSSTATLTGYYNNMIAFTSVASNCTSNQAMNIGNSSVTLNGSFDAPNGCINISGSSITVNGSLIGNEVQVGVGSSSVINSTTGGSGGGFLYQ